MEQPGTAEQILLALRSDPTGENAGSTPVSRIGDLLATDTGTLSERIELLSALSELVDDRLVCERVQSPDDGADERNVYALTEAGRERAAALEARVVDDRVTVRGPDGERTVRLGDVDCFDDRPLVRAVARLTDDGVVPVGTPVEEAVVDREAEHERLCEAFDTASAGSATTVRITGSNGVGKTTVLERLLATARDRGATTFLGSCQQDGTVPYGPFRTAFDDPTVADGREPPGRPDRPLRTDRAVTVDDEEGLQARRSALFDDVVDYVREVAAETPVVLAIDDLQWIAEPSAALFATLAAALEDAPVLLLACYRDRTDEGSEALSTALESTDPERTVELGPFDRERTRRLVESLCETRDVPASFVDAVYERTDGVPAFVAATVDTLREEGVVDPAVDVYPDRESIPLPAAARTAVERRLSGLDRTATDLLRVAAADGESTTVSVLTDALDVDRATVENYLDALADGRPLGRDGETLSFAGGVVKDAVLAATPAERRRDLHRRLARAHADAPAERHAAVARHHEAAGDDEAAVDAYRAAADAARSVYAHELAVEKYERALSLARDADDETAVLDTLEDLAAVRYVLGAFEAADRACQYVTERARDDERRRRAYAERSQIHREWGEFDDALELAEQGLAITDGDSPATCELLGRKGWVWMQRGAHDDARSVFERRLEMSRRLDDQAFVANALHDLGTATVKAGAVADAVAPLEAAVERRRSLDDRRALATSLNNLGLVHWKLGDLETAAEYIEEAADALHTVGDRKGRSATLTNLGVLAESLGNYDEALAYYERSRAASERLDDRRGESLLYGNVAGVCLKLGRIEDALDNCEAGLAIARDIDDDPGVTAIGATAAEALSLGGDLDEARSRAQEALDVARQIGNDERMATALDVAGTVARIDGDPEAAADDHRDGRDRATDAGTTKKVVANLVGLAWDHLAGDAPEAASEAANDAVAAADDVDDPYLELRAETVHCAVRRIGGEDVANEASAVVEAATELGLGVVACRARIEHGLALSARGEKRAAARELAAATADAETIGAAHIADRAAVERDRIDDAVTG